MLDGFEIYKPIIRTKFDQWKYNLANKNPREVHCDVFKNQTLEPGLSKIFLFITLLCSWCLSSLTLASISIFFTVIVCLHSHILSKIAIEYEQIKHSEMVNPTHKYIVWRPIFDLQEKIVLAQAIFTFLLILASLYTGIVHIIH